MANLYNFMRGANFMGLLGYIYQLEIEILRSKKEKNAIFA